MLVKQRALGWPAAGEEGRSGPHILSSTEHMQANQPMILLISRSHSQIDSTFISKTGVRALGIRESI